MLKGIITAPLRFIAWLTTDTGRRRPGYGEVLTQHEAGLATGAQRKMLADAEAERQRVDELKQHQKAADDRRAGRD